MELYYNPERMSETEVRETFVANQWLVDEILKILKQQPKGAGVQHALIIAPRGMGKTTALLMLRFSILGSEMAQSWQPVLFPEESYAVYDLADFWLSGLNHLATETNDEDLKQKVSELQSMHRESTELEEAALATIKDWRSEHQRQVLMLVDSVDIILDQIGDERDHAKLRDVLMNDGTMMLVGGATTFFKEARDYGQPLYNLFKTYDLQGLNSEQIHELLRRRAKLDGAENFDEQLRRNASRLRVLEYFTGGNPRLVMMLYRVITRSEVSEVRRGLEKLLDEVTPYYKAKIESLPPQQRKILDHIARISARTREGLTPTEIAASVRLGVNQVSAQLKRLADIGYVSSANIRGRSSYYTLAEPLYAIWHQMRFGREARERMHWLVTFLKGWYDAEEISSESTRLQNIFYEYLRTGRVAEARDVLEHRKYLMDALEHSSDRARTGESIVLSYLALKDVETLRREVLPQVNLALLTEATQERLVAAGLLTKTGVKQPTSDQSTEIQEATVSFELGREALDNEKFDGALKCFSHSVELDPRNSQGWCYRALALIKLGRYDEALESVDRAIQISPDSPNAYHLRGVSLVRLNRHEDALSALDRALEIDPTLKESWYLRASSLWELERNDQLLESIEKACELESDAHDALLARSIILSLRGRIREALKLVDSALKLDADSFDAFYFRGLMLNEMDQHEPSIKAFRNAFNTGSTEHKSLRDTSIAISMKFLLNVRDGDLNEARLDWQRLRECAQAEETNWHELAFKVLRQAATPKNGAFIKQLVSESDLEEPLFPLARALDYLATRDGTLIEKLSPEVKKIVEEIIQTLQNSPIKKSHNKKKANKKPAKA